MSNMAATSINGKKKTFFLQKQNAYNDEIWHAALFIKGLGPIIFCSKDDFDQLYKVNFGCICFKKVV